MIQLLSVLVIMLSLGVSAFAASDSAVVRGGDLRIRDEGTGLVFPDGSIQYKATVEGPQGPAGPANQLEIGTVTSGTTAGATITGIAPSQTINLVLPQGPKGDPGSAGTINLTSICTAITAGGASLPSFCLPSTYSTSDLKGTWKLYVLGATNGATTPVYWERSTLTININGVATQASYIDSEFGSSGMTTANFVISATGDVSLPSYPNFRFGGTMSLDRNVIVLTYNPDMSTQRGMMILVKIAP